MPTTRHTLRGLAALSLLALAPCAQALNYHFTFTQAGYEFGARVEGALYLQDFNNDGMISDDGPLGDSLGGHMQLIGHPTYPNLTVTFYGGWFNLQTLDFQVHGDSPAPWNYYQLVDGFIATSRGGFSDLPGNVEILSNAPVVLTRVPDGGATFLMLGAALLVFLFGRRCHGITSVSMVR